MDSKGIRELIKFITKDYNENEKFHIKVEILNSLRYIRDDLIVSGQEKHYWNFKNNRFYVKEEDLEITVFVKELFFNEIWICLL